MFTVKNDFNNANIARTIRFTEKIYSELTEIAQVNDVSFNLLVLQCCRYSIDHLKRDYPESTNDI